MSTFTTLRYELHHGVAIITLDQPDSPVNTMCAAWQVDLGGLVDQLRADRAQLKGVVLASAKTSFMAGADLKGLMNSPLGKGHAAFQEIEQMKSHFRFIETLGVPVVALLNGSALGGGWEMALVAHHRLALRGRRAQFGLPEVTLGLIPGAGGITKMTRLLGIQAAQPHLMEGQLFSAEEGHRLGLIHELLEQEGELLPRALALIEAAQGQAAQQPYDRKDFKMPGGTAASPKIASQITVAPAMLRLKTRGLYPAPEAIMACMVEGSLVDTDTALRIESRYLARILTGQVSRNMINTFFFNLNSIKSGASRPQGQPKSKPLKVGVLGAGMMGSGIAYAQASKGIDTVLKDVSLEAAEKGKAYSQRLTQKRVDKGRMTVEAQQALLQRIQPTASADDLQGCDLIIEAVYENRELKARVTQEAEPRLAPGGFFASNTSTLPITGLAKASARPAQFIGIHFFSPVDKMKLVEIIRGRDTDDATVARAYDYVLALGKLPIVVNDSRGFYTSRTFGTFVMEGAALLGEGVPAALIENAAMQAGMPVGPLAVLDETSLSLSVHVLDQTRADLAAEGHSHTATPGELLVERMVKELQRPGRAGGGGFYNYPAGEKKQLWPELKRLFEKAGPHPSAADIQERLLMRQAVETARCLSEGVLTSVHEGNVGSIFGIGFPAYTGGALQYIYAMGVDAFAQRCAERAARHGSGFALSDDVVHALHQHQPRY